MANQPALLVLKARAIVRITLHRLPSLAFLSVKGDKVTCQSLSLVPVSGQPCLPASQIELEICCREGMSFCAPNARA